MSILVLGTVALDTVKTPFGGRKSMLGGSAVHFSMSARLFTDVHLVAAIGEDFPQKHILFLKQKKIILDSLIACTGKTFQWEGEYEGDLNSARTIRTELGVLCTFKPEVALSQKGIKNLFLANVDPDIQRSLVQKMRSPQLVGLDSMNFWIHNKRKALLRALKHADIFVANDQEARDLSAETNLIKAARFLHSLGPKMVLIKKGEHGVFFYSDMFLFSLPAYPTQNVVDPTGAGDTFAGGFMGYLVKARKVNAQTIKRALAYGTIAASFNVEGFGVERTGRLKIKDLNARLSRYKECFLF